MAMPEKTPCQMNIDYMDLKGLVHFVWRYKLFIFAFVSLSMVVSMIYAYSTGSLWTHIHQSRCVISPVDHTVENPFKKKSEEKSADGALTGGVKKITALLNSRGLADSVVQKNLLMPRLFPDMWDNRNQRWRQSPPPTLQDAYERLQKMLKVRADEVNHSLVIMCYHPDPVFSRQMLLYYLEGLDIFLRERSKEVIDLQLANLRLQLAAEKDQNVRRVLSSLIAFQVERRNLTKSLGYYGFYVVSEPMSFLQESSIRTTVLTYVIFPATVASFAFIIALVMALLFEYFIISKRDGVAKH